MNKWVVAIITMLIMFLFLIAQINLFNSLPLFGVIANCGIVLVSALGIVSGKSVGGAVGFGYGLMCDFVFSKTLGLYTLLYLAIGILSRIFTK